MHADNTRKHARIRFAGGLLLFLTVMLLASAPRPAGADPDTDLAECETAESAAPNQPEISPTPADPATEPPECEPETGIASERAAAPAPATTRAGYIAQAKMEHCIQLPTARQLRPARAAKTYRKFCSPHAPVAHHPAERQWLAHFYQELDGANWNRNDNWNSNLSLEQWHGVVVDDRGFLLGLELPNNNLSGDLEPALTPFEHLNMLHLEHNPELAGCLPIKLEPQLLSWTEPGFPSCAPPAAAGWEWPVPVLETTAIATISILVGAVAVPWLLYFRPRKRSRDGWNRRQTQTG